MFFMSYDAVFARREILLREACNACTYESKLQCWNQLRVYPWNRSLPIVQTIGALPEVGWTFWS